MAKLPDSFQELLAVADTKLALAAEGGARRVFMKTGDEITPDEFELIEHDDILYFSTGDDWVAPPPEAEQPVVAPAAAAPTAEAASSAAATGHSSAADSPTTTAPSATPMDVDGAADAAAGRGPR